MSLVQIARVTGRIDRVPRGDTPVVELDLEDHQRVVSVELKALLFDDPGRKTVDWKYVVYVETRL